MRTFFKWHRNYLSDRISKSGLDYYQITWISFFKGLIIGFIIAYNF